MSGVTLLAGQLAALARLGALGDLDLELLGPREVLGGDAEPGRRDLLDGRVTADAAGPSSYQAGVLAALAAVGAPPEPPHARWSAPGAPRG